MMTDTPATTPDWLAAAERIFPGRAVTVRSEADLTVEVDGRAVRIRQWAPEATVERVRAIRELLGRAPASAGVPALAGDDVAFVGGRVHDGCEPVGGLPLNRHGVFHLPGHGEVAIPLHESADHGDMLVEAARALGQVHQATRGHVDPNRTGATSAAEVHTATKAYWQDARRRLGGKAEELVEVRRWLRCGNRVIPIAADRLGAAGESATGHPVLLHDNLWPAYLMVDDPSRPMALRGIEGWTSAVAGPPVLDLAALCVRVTGWSEATVESILGAYSDHAPLMPAERRLVPVVAAVDLVGQLGRLLELAYLDDAIATDPAQPFIRGGIKVLLRSLERLTAVLAPPEPGTRRPGGGPVRRGAPRSPRSGRTPAGGRSPRRQGPPRRGRG
jgi:hypothetical protein